MTKPTLEQAFMALALNAPISVVQTKSPRPATLTNPRNNAEVKKISSKPTASLKLQIEKALTKRPKKWLVASLP